MWWDWARAVLSIAKVRWHVQPGEATKLEAAQTSIHSGDDAT
jgi:hypothetical protein